MRKRVDI